MDQAEGKPTGRAQAQPAASRRGQRPQAQRLFRPLLHVVHVDVEVAPGSRGPGALGPHEGIAGEGHQGDELSGPASGRGQSGGRDRLPERAAPLEERGRVAREVEKGRQPPDLHDQRLTGTDLGRAKLRRTRYQNNHYRVGLFRRQGGLGCRGRLSRLLEPQL
jgi:hypothetical protein